MTVTAEREEHSVGTTWAPDGDPSGPSATNGSGNGAESAVCACGAGPHPEHEFRCANGHMTEGNQAAVVTGSRSLQFWEAHEEERRDLVEAVVSDAGHRMEDAPRTLLLAADGLAQAVLVRNSAYLRMAAEGGALSTSGKARKCHEVWQGAVDRVERHVRLLGLRREPRAAATSPSEALARAPSLESERSEAQQREPRL